MNTSNTNRKTISGFSKLSKLGKLRWLVENFFKDPEAVKKELIGYWREAHEQEVIDNISENTITNFILPYSVAPNFLINGHMYCVPMVIEESSVVAAASSAAKYWMSRGGILTEVMCTEKVGHVHFLWSGDFAALKAKEPQLRKRLMQSVSKLTYNMEKRGGGIVGIELVDKSEDIEHYYQLALTAETCDSMGANFINSILETFAQELILFVSEQDDFTEADREVEVIMSILSNYTPRCKVRAWVECAVEELTGFEKYKFGAADFARRFYTAVRIAQVDSYRATTHNKGIMNGVDAVILATGNDFRAIEAGVHTYAARLGQYQSLSECKIADGKFHFSLELPLALGTVGGLTSLHPIAKRSLELLGNPSARELMEIVAATGLMQNFAALRSLVTSGIQQGHMKMHLTNILNQLGATPQQKQKARAYFENKVVSFDAVRTFLKSL